MRPTTVASRPVIGIGLGNDVFLTAHALASGGPDAAAIVRVTINFFRQPQMRHLSCSCRDFNRSPDRLENDLMTEHLERVVAVLAPTEPTQIGGGILDYGVIVD